MCVCVCSQTCCTTRHAMRTTTRATPTQLRRWWWAPSTPLQSPTTTTTQREHPAADWRHPLHRRRLPRLPQPRRLDCLRLHSLHPPTLHLPSLRRRRSRWWCLQLRSLTPSPSLPTRLPLRLRLGRHPLLPHRRYVYIHATQINRGPCSGQAIRLSPLDSSSVCHAFWIAAS